jgi:two-component system CheB/CheR fusion protein
MVEHEEKIAAERIGRLTRRQKQILAMVTDGQLNKQAAHDLGVSQRTVENHRQALMKKTDTKTLPELVRLFLLAGE